MYVVKAHVEAGRHREEIKLALVSAARRGTPCTQPSGIRDRSSSLMSIKCAVSYRTKKPQY